MKTYIENIDNVQLSFGYIQRKFRDYWRDRVSLMTSKSILHLKEKSHGDDIVHLTRNTRTGTSFFRIELPMYAIKRNYPDEFNLVYADGNIGPNHVAVADLLIFHRAGGHHDFLHKVFKVWPKTKKRPLVIHDKIVDVV